MTVMKMSSLIMSYKGTAINPKTNERCAKYLVLSEQFDIVGDMPHERQIRRMARRYLGRWFQHFVLVRRNAAVVDRDTLYLYLEGGTEREERAAFLAALSTHCK